MAWWAVGVFSAALVQDFFHGWQLGGWRPTVIALWCFSVVLWLLTAPPVVARLPTAHFGKHDGFTSVWIEPAAKPLWSERSRAKREIQLGKRAIAVGKRVLDVYAEAHEVTNQLLIEKGFASYQTEYQKQLNKIKAEVGGAWEEVIRELDEAGVLPDSADIYSISVNFTGLDRKAMEVQALGRQLMRKHGKEPPN